MYDIRYVDGISILKLYGEVTMLEVEQIQRALKSLRNHKHRRVVIDLANVDHLHYSALKKWVGEALLLREDDGDLRLVGANEYTQNMIRFTGADQYLSDYQSAGDAILSFLNKHSYYSENFDAFDSKSTYFCDDDNLEDEPKLDPIWHH